VEYVASRLIVYRWLIVFSTGDNESDECHFYRGTQVQEVRPSAEVASFACALFVCMCVRIRERCGKCYHGFSVVMGKYLDKHVVLPR